MFSFLMIISPDAISSAFLILIVLKSKVRMSSLIEFLFVASIWKKDF